MTAKIVGDIVAPIPLPNGHTRYLKVGVLLEQENNDASKGPGFTIMIDRTFNPAGLPGHGASAGLSVYWQREKEDRSGKETRVENGPGMEDPFPPMVGRTAQE